MHRVALITSASTLLWMLLSAGFVTVNMDTFKYVPAALLFIPAFGLFILSRPRYGLDRVSHRFLLLSGIHFMLTLFPSMVWHYGYDEPYLLALNGLCYVVVLFVVLSPEPVSLLRRLIALLTAALAILSIAGILEYFGLVFLTLNRHITTIATTFNNPNLYAAVLLVLLPAGYIAILIAPSRPTRYLAAAAAILGLVNLVMAQSRAALIGHFCSLLVLAVVLPTVYQMPRQRKRRLWILGFGLFFAAVIAFLLLNTQFRNKIIQTFTVKNSRFSAWGIALDIWTREPKTILFGNGIGSFKPLFFTFKPPGYRLGPSMEWWDAAHNEYLELLVDGGILSLTAFLAMIGFVVRSIYITFRNTGAGRETRVLMLFPACVLAALLADGLFSTALRTNYILVLFYLVVSFVPALADRSGPDSAERGKHPRLLTILPAMVFCILLALSPVLIRRFSAEHLMVKAHLAESPEKREQLLQKAAEADRRNAWPRDTLARFYLGTGNTTRFRDIAAEVEARVENFTDIGYLRGLAAMEEGNLPRATELLESYLYLDRGDPDAENALLYTYTAAGLPSKAVEQWNRIQEHLYRKYELLIPEIIIGRGDGITTEDNTLVIGRHQAADILTAAAGSSPVPLPVFLFRINYITGDILRQAGNPRGAVFFLNRAIRSAGSDRLPEPDRELHHRAARFLLEYYAESLNSAENRQEEIEALKGLRSLTDNPELDRRLAALYRKQGSFKKAALVLRGY